MYSPSQHWLAACLALTVADILPIAKCYGTHRKQGQRTNLLAVVKDAVLLGTKGMMLIQHSVPQAHHNLARFALACNVQLGLAPMMG